MAFHCSNLFNRIGITGTNDMNIVTLLPPNSYDDRLAKCVLTVDLYFGRLDGNEELTCVRGCRPIHFGPAIAMWCPEAW